MSSFVFRAAKTKVSSTVSKESRSYFIVVSTKFETEVVVPAMQTSAKRFSIRALLLMIAAIAIILGLSVPIFTRANAPQLTDQRSYLRPANSKFPVVSSRVFLSGANMDCARILFLHQKTKHSDGNEFPDWFEPEQTEDGHVIRRSPVICLLNGKRLYPHDDSYVTIVYASDDEPPVTIRVLRSKYDDLPPNDTNLIWETLVDETL